MNRDEIIWYSALAEFVLAARSIYGCAEFQYSIIVNMLAIAIFKAPNWGHLFFLLFVHSNLIFVKERQEQTLTDELLNELQH